MSRTQTIARVKELATEIGLDLKAHFKITKLTTGSNDLWNQRKGELEQMLIDNRAYRVAEIEQAAAAYKQKQDDEAAKEAAIIAKNQGTELPEPELQTHALMHYTETYKIDNMNEGYPIVIGDLNTVLMQAEAKIITLA